MKIRKGFVSNSSSSSFVCDVSGEVVSGMDFTLDDAEMYQCEKEHIFCDAYLITDIPIIAKRLRVVTDESLDEVEVADSKNMNDTDFEAWYNDLCLGRYDVPSAFCPVCSFQYVTDDDLLLYFLKKSTLRKEDAVKHIQKEFKSYNSFSNYITRNHIVVD